MKKKMIGAVFAIALAAVSSWNIFQSRQDVTLSDLMIENAEALARNEIENYYNFHLVSYTSGCKVCESSGKWCNVNDQEPC